MRALARVLRISTTQFGVVSRRQLIAGDVSDHEISHLIRVGAIERVHPGTYVVAGSERTVAACPRSLPRVW